MPGRWPPHSSAVYSGETQQPAPDRRSQCLVTMNCSKTPRTGCVLSERIVWNKKTRWKQSILGTDLLQALKRHKLCQYCLLLKSMYTHQPPTQVRPSLSSVWQTRRRSGAEDGTPLSQGCCPQAGKGSEGGALWEFYFHLPNSGFQALCPSAATITILCLLLSESLPRKRFTQQL